MKEGSRGHADSVYTLRNNASPGNVLLRTPSQKNGSEEGIYVYANARPFRHRKRKAQGQKKAALAYVPQDANVASGECPSGRRSPKLLHFLLLELAYILDGEEEQPIGCVLEKRRTEPVDNTRCVGFLIAEHLTQRSFN